MQVFLGIVIGLVVAALSLFLLASSNWGTSIVLANETRKLKKTLGDHADDSRVIKRRFRLVDPRTKDRHYMIIVWERLYRLGTEFSILDEVGKEVLGGCTCGLMEERYKEIVHQYSWMEAGQPFWEGPVEFGIEKMVEKETFLELDDIRSNPYSINKTIRSNDGRVVVTYGLNSEGFLKLVITVVGLPESNKDALEALAAALPESEVINGLLYMENCSPQDALAAVNHVLEHIESKTTFSVSNKEAALVTAK